MSSNEINTMIEAIAEHTISKLPKGDGITFGTIKQLNPLVIRVDNHNFDLPEEYFFLGQMCRPHRVTIPHKHEYNGITEIASDGGMGASPHQHDIYHQITEDLHVGTGGYKQDYVTLEIYPKLKVGDRVLLLAFNGGERYYVAERIEKESDVTGDDIH